jgi:hypothetical protein
MLGVLLLGASPERTQRPWPCGFDQWSLCAQLAPQALRLCGPCRAPHPATRFRLFGHFVPTRSSNVCPVVCTSDCWLCGLCAWKGYGMCEGCVRVWTPPWMRHVWWLRALLCRGSPAPSAAPSGSCSGWLRDLVPYGEAWTLVWEPAIVRRVTNCVNKFFVQYMKGKLVSRAHPLTFFCFSQLLCLAFANAVLSSPCRSCPAPPPLAGFGGSEAYTAEQLAGGVDVAVLRRVCAVVY